MWTYRSGLHKEEILNTLKKTELKDKAVLALHSAAEAHGYKNTNLNTLELYIMDLNAKAELEKALELMPQERGYEVLLIDPYYKSLIKQETKEGDFKVSPILLTFLDLYHNL